MQNLNFSMKNEQEAGKLAKRLYFDAKRKGAGGKKIDAKDPEVSKQLSQVIALSKTLVPTVSDPKSLSEAAQALSEGVANVVSGKVSMVSGNSEVPRTGPGSAERCAQARVELKAHIDKCAAKVPTKSPVKRPRDVKEHSGVKQLVTVATLNPVTGSVVNPLVSSDTTAAARPSGVSTRQQSLVDWTRFARAEPLQIDEERLPDKTTPLKNMCMELDVKFEVSHTRSCTASVRHNVDGQVIRPAARRRMMAELYAITQGVMLRKGLDGQVQRWVDAYGALRNKEFVHKINSKCDRSEVKLQIHRDTIVPKDVLRNALYIRETCEEPGPDTYNKVWETDSSISKYLSDKYFDAVLYEDVQQSGCTDRTSVFNTVSRGVCVGLVFHLQVGQLGKQGAQGVWFKEEGKTIALAHDGDNPYTDDVDMLWLTEGSYALHNGTHISWFIEKIYGNVFYAIVFPASKQIANLESMQPPGCVELARINFSTSIEWSVLSMFKYSDWRTVEVHSEIANAVGRSVLNRTLQGMTDKAVLDKVAVELSQSGLGLLAKYRPKRYNDLVTHTAIAARNIAMHMQVVYYTGARARAVEGAQVIDDALNVNSVASRLMPSCVNWCFQWMPTEMGCPVHLQPLEGYLIMPFAGSCCALSCLPLCCQAAANSSFQLCPTWFSGYTLLGGSVRGVPDEYHEGILSNVGPMLDYISNLNACVDYGIIRNSRREYQQTKVVSELRAGLEAKDIMYKKGSLMKVWEGEKFTQLKEDKSPVTYSVGPSPLPFHFNAKSAGGMMGIVASIIKPIKNDKLYSDICEPITSEWQAEGWKKFALIPIVDDQFYVGSIPVSGCTKHERIVWANTVEGSKKALYLRCIEENEKSDRKLIPFDRVDLMSKTNDALLKPKERVICAFDPHVTVALAPEIKIATQNLKTIWFANQKFSYWDGLEFKSYYGPGKSAEELGVIADYMTTIKDGQYVGIYAGDDQVGAIKICGHWFGVEGDASDWDNSQSFYENHGPISYELEDLVKLGFPKEFVKDIKAGNAGKLHAINPDDTAERIIINLESNPRRQSGESGTSLLNTLGSARLYVGLLSMARTEMIRIFDETSSWDDMAVWLKKFMAREAQRLGHALKLRVERNIGNLTFLKGFFVPCVVGNRNTLCWFPSPEIMCKVGITETCAPSLMQYCKVIPKKNSNSTLLKWQQFAADVVYGNKQYKEQPLIGALLESIRPQVNLDDETRELVRVKKYHQVDKAVLTSEHDWSYMLERLDIDQSEWDDFITKVRKMSWKPGQFLIHPVWVKLSTVYQ